MAGPTHFSQQNMFVRIGLLNLSIAFHYPFQGMFQRNLFPVGQDVNGDIVHISGQLRVIDPHIPGFGSTDRTRNLLAHSADVFNQFLNLQVPPKNRFITDNDTRNRSRIGSGVSNQVSNFPFIFVLVRVQPSAGRYTKPVANRHPRNIFKPVDRRITANTSRHPSDHFQIAIYLIRKWIYFFHRILPLMKRAERDSLNLVGPGRNQGSRAIKRQPDSHVSQNNQKQYFCLLH